MKEFNRSRQLDWVEFSVDGDVFRAVNSAPTMAILDVSQVKDADNVQRVRTLMAFMDKVLEPESAARFAERMASPQNPIEVDQIADVAIWLVQEVYAPDRPTEAPSSSPNGSSTTGQSSTASAPA